MANYEFRKDGKLHDYAVYYVCADGSKNAGYMESMYVFNPGETIEDWNGRQIVIDFEL